MPEGVVLDINGRQFEDCRELSDVKLLDDEMFVPDMCFCGCVELDDSWIGESVNPPPLIEAGVSLLKIDE